MAGDLLGHRIDRGEGVVAVTGVGLDDRHDLAGRAEQVWHADPVAGPSHLDRLAVRRQRGAVVDVVHPVEFHALARVDLDDHLAGLVDPGLVVADRGRRDELTVPRQTHCLDHGEIQRAEEALPYHLGDVGQVDVDIVHPACVDLLPADWIGLVGQPELDAVDRREGAVQFGRGGGAGPHADPERPPVAVRGVDMPGQRGRHRLRITGSGEPAHSDVRAWSYQRGRVVGGHDLASEVSRLYPGMTVHTHAITTPSFLPCSEP